MVEDSLFDLCPIVACCCCVYAKCEFSHVGWGWPPAIGPVWCPPGSVAADDYALEHREFLGKAPVNLLMYVILCCEFGEALITVQPAGDMVVTSGRSCIRYTPACCGRLQTKFAAMGNSPARGIARGFHVHTCNARVQYSSETELVSVRGCLDQACAHVHWIRAGLERLESSGSDEFGL